MDVELNDNLVDLADAEQFEPTEEELFLMNQTTHAPLVGEGD